ncbi:MAG: NAD(P)-binding domain-containing protein, partial [Pseudomonadota bacterium]
MAKTAFLGLGVMGAPMAGWLARAGHDVVVYNRTASKAEAWAAARGEGAANAGGRGSAATSVADAVAGAEIVFACLGGDP